MGFLFVGQVIHVRGSRKDIEPSDAAETAPDSGSPGFVCGEGRGWPGLRQPCLRTGSPNSSGPQTLSVPGRSKCLRLVPCLPCMWSARSVLPLCFRVFQYRRERLAQVPGGLYSALSHHRVTDFVCARQSKCPGSLHQSLQFVAVLFAAVSPFLCCSAGSA